MIYTFDTLNSLQFFDALGINKFYQFEKAEN